jgi:hypothetical protein
MSHRPRLLLAFLLLLPCAYAMSANPTVSLELAPFTFQLPPGFQDLRGSQAKSIDVPADLRAQGEALPDAAFAGRNAESGTQIFFATTSFPSPGPLTSKNSTELFKVIESEAPQYAVKPTYISRRLFMINGVACAVQELELALDTGTVRSLRYLIPSGRILAVVQFDAPNTNWNATRDEFDASMLRTKGVSENTGSTAEYWGWRVGRYLGRLFK